MFLILNINKCRILEVVDDVVFAYFAIEMVIKMVAMGVWGRLGYLGDSWNRLDQGCTNVILFFRHLLTCSILFFFRKFFMTSLKRLLYCHCRGIGILSSFGQHEPDGYQDDSGPSSTKGNQQSSFHENPRHAPPRNRS